MLLRNRRSPTSRRSTLRTWLSFCFAEGILATPLVVVATPGNFILAALFVSWGYPADLYGIILSLRCWCNLLQVGLSPIVARYWPPRIFYFVFVGLNTAWWGLIGVLLLTSAHLNQQFTLILLLLVGAHLTGAMTGVAWISWVHEWIPSRLHAPFFSQRIRWTDLTTVLFSFGAAFLLPIESPHSRPFAVILLSAVALRLVALLLSFRITPQPLDNRPAVVSSQLSAVCSDRGFMRFMIFSITAGLALASFAPFVPMFMLQQLGQSGRDLGFCAALAMLAGVICFPTWGRLVKRVGYRPALAAALLLWLVTNVGWCFITRDMLWLVYVIWGIGGMATAGIVLGKLGLLLRLVPNQATTAGIGLYIAVTSFAAAVGPIAAGWWLSTGGIIPTISAYHRFFVLQPVILALAILLLWRDHRVR